MKKRKVLLFSVKADPHADRIAELISSNVEAARLNLDDPNTWGLHYCDGDVQVRLGSDVFGLDQIVSIFVRRIPDLDSFKNATNPKFKQYDDFIGKQNFSLFSDCLSILDHTKPFVNPLASVSRLGKAIQAKAAIEVGLQTPATYMGSSAVDAVSFIDRSFGKSRKVCTKPIVNFKINIGGLLHTRFTEMLTPQDVKSIGSIEYCPVIIQEYIEKTYEIRAAVIGDRVFAARIDSQSGGLGTSVDWRRYNIPKTPHSAYNLPQDIMQRLIEMHSRLGLIYSSFDLIRNPDGEYIFLETNPYGQWLWIEDLTGLKISNAIAEFLSEPTK